MSQTKYKKVASELSVQEKQVEVTVKLLDEGGTIPFISRYRKEMTGSLDEVQVAAIRDRMQQLIDLDKRREAIIKSMKDLNVLTPELESQINNAETMVLLEDIYLPYKPKRKTKASVARERGLQPLADKIFEQSNIDIEIEAAKYIDEEKGLPSSADALAGARDILAEYMSENADLRAKMRMFFFNKGSFHSRLIKGKEEAGQKYKDYFDWTGAVKSAPSHRVLALRRAEKEIVLTLDIEVPEEEAVLILENMFVTSRNAAAGEVKIAAADSFKRLIKPSMETEIRLLTKKAADTEAIRVFADNARQLLLAAPVGQKRIMAIDPGFRTGCKVVCLDEQGQLIENTNIYPHNGNESSKEAAKSIRFLADKYKIEAIAIGNGTAGRETETFVRSLDLTDAIVVMVNESGASIYSASDVAREEFPDKDITVRGAVSIGRRLMDPLAELVKIDPKSIGVGQYQHDVDQTHLQTSLDDTVISCVNSIGVELNTASKQILSYISGLGPQLAQNIVEHRNKNGAFKRRSDLKQIPRLGEKAFEQAAGFLRIRNSEHPLDGSAVHPERYSLVEKMAKDLGCTLEDLIKEDKFRKQIRLQNYVSESVGLPTLNDILNELAKPGLDPRDQFEAFTFSEGINAITDLRVGMTLPGIVTNITAFGAFIDIGVHQDGLVHVSQLSNKFVKDPNDVVKVSQKVQVKVTEVDIPRKRIALTMKIEEAAPAKPKFKKPERVEVRSVPKPKPETDIAIKLAALRNKFS
ncbi:Tex family protein [Daejeonella sp.]|uniref:Tex family protein n=1 Tax=Daejeonella sp. TaxID=2805397 RepID=UPI0030C42A53